MWQHMNSRPHNPTTPTNNTAFVRDVDEGIRRVLSGAGDYAFIMESAMAQYEVNRRPCDLKIIEPDPDDASMNNVVYAIATQKKSPLLELLNRELLRMIKAGYLEQRFKHWWRHDEAEEKRRNCSSRAIAHTAFSDAVDGTGWKTPNATANNNKSGAESLPFPALANMLLSSIIVIFFSWYIFTLKFV